MEMQFGSVKGKTSFSLARRSPFAHLCFTKTGGGSAKPTKNKFFLGSALAFRYLCVCFSDINQKA